MKGIIEEINSKLLNKKKKNFLQKNLIEKKKNSFKLC